jgi:hypothetical protein
MVNSNSYKFKIAIIDSGIEFSHEKLITAKISGLTIHSAEDGLIKYLPNEFNDVGGHGTAIASIIHKIVPDIELVAVKLSSYSGIITEELLVEGIEYCMQENSIQLINISLGIATNTPISQLFETCKKAYERNIYIVASSHNYPGLECYPASFPNVIGVTAGYVRSKLEYKYIKEGNMNIIAKGTTARMAWVNNGYRITSGTSFATAHFSGILATILRENPFSSRERIDELIKKKSSENVVELQYTRTSEQLSIPKKISLNQDVIGKTLFDPSSNFHQVNKIALFPICEKEIKTIIDFKELSPFEITTYIDYPRSLNFNTERIHPKLNIIRRELTLEEFNQFDTLVVGYFLDQLFDANIIFASKLIDRAIFHNKSFIIWDFNVYNFIKKRIGQRRDEYNGKIFFSFVNYDEFNRVMEYRYLPQVTKPVILVAGTSNKQGKITTQLCLRKILEKEGYRVAHLATEPQGVLVNANYIFPYGHNSCVEIKENLWGKFIYTVLKGIERYSNPHIIITGTQGGTIPRSYTIEELTNEGIFSSLQYISGVQPDAIILVINPQDSISLIQNTVSSIMNYCRGKLLFYAMTPWIRNFSQNVLNGKTIANHSYLTKDRMSVKMNEFAQILGSKVIDIMDETNNTFILETIEDAFSKKQ